MERRTIEGREVLLEFQRVGEYVKVTAMDPVSLHEVSIVGSPRASEAELTRLVLRKLEFVESKKPKDAAKSTGGRSSSGGGIEV